VEGISETARALRLNVERLKERVGEGGTATGRERRKPGATFVELTGLGSLGGGGAVVELETGGGERMRIHLASTADVVSLAEALWRGRS